MEPLRTFAPSQAGLGYVCPTWTKQRCKVNPQLRRGRTEVGKGERACVQSSFSRETQGDFKDQTEELVPSAESVCQARDEFPESAAMMALGFNKM